MICVARFDRLTQLIFSPHISPAAPPSPPAGVVFAEAPYFRNESISNLVERKYPARRDSRDPATSREVELHVFVDDELEDLAGRLVLLVLEV